MDQTRHPRPATAQLARVEVARGELLDPSSLSAIASELAHRQAAQLTREALRRRLSRLLPVHRPRRAPRGAHARERPRLPRPARMPWTVAGDDRQALLRPTHARLRAWRRARARRPRPTRRARPAARSHRPAVRAASADAGAAPPASATSRCCTCSAPLACAAPKRARSCSPTSTSAAAQATGGCAERSPLDLLVGHCAIRQARPPPHGPA